MESRLRVVGPPIAVLVAIFVVWLVWDIREQSAIEHDQASYLLQARIFASGRWTAPSPPIAEFFEQPHVQLVPAVASKYPPGHALLLALGARIGAPWLIPLLLTGATVALLFVLVTRVTNAWAATFACAFWITAPIVLRFQGSYFSETTTATATLGAWWCLLEWRETRKARWMALLAFAVGWGAITRPLTMLALAIPIGIVVMRDVARLRRWRDLALGVGVGTAVLAVLPLWSVRTTGSWRESPLVKYQRDYLPFDKPGYSVDTTPPRRRASFDPVHRAMHDHFLEMRKDQSPETIPQVLTLRLLNIVIGSFQGLRLVLLVLAVVGLVAGGPALRFAALSGLTLVLAYLPYAHWEKWSLYYLELAPVAAGLSAAGLWVAATRRLPAPHAGVATVAAAAALLLGSIPSIERWHSENFATNTQYRRFAMSLDSLSPKPAIVFVAYSRRSTSYMAVVRNVVHPDSAPVWVVHDLGARNAELQRLAPHRTVFHVDVSRQ